MVTVSRRLPRAQLSIGAVEHLLDGPGEYEIRGVQITGIATILKGPLGEDRRNVVYSVVMDGVTVCHLGRLDQLPTGDPLQQIGAPDVILIGIGEGQGLAPAQAAQLASQLEARILVPVPLGGPAGDGAVERFCREMGADPQNVLPRLSVSASGMPAQTQVVRLVPAIPPAPGGGLDA